jgi:hypothetical protein
MKCGNWKNLEKKGETQPTAKHGSGVWAFSDARLLRKIGQRVLY